MIVPVPSVVVVVVVVDDVCAKANGATSANPIVRSCFFILFPFLVRARRKVAAWPAVSIQIGFGKIAGRIINITYLRVVTYVFL